MNTQPTNTFYDSPERADDSVIQEQRRIIHSHPSVTEILEGYPDMVVVLNEYRQIITCNSKALEVLEINDESEIIGKRLGESINCIHAFDDPSGCGTTKFCKLCGAAQAIKTTKDFRNSDVQECRIIRKIDHATAPLDFRVHTTPVKIDDYEFTITAVENIADEKRRETLERIFFHDILNTAGALEGYANLLKDVENDEEFEEFADAINNISHQIIEEIKSQRQLLKAENRTLETEFKETSVNKIITKVYEMFVNHDLAENINLHKETLKEDITVNTDPLLLRRSLSNLVKNALEASNKGGTVKIYSILEKKKITFNVYNNEVIPEDVQLQIFQRPFSTKAKRGRGIGTYSVILLVEKYLHGKVYFTSDQTTKTIFSVELPLSE